MNNRDVEFAFGTEVVGRFTGEAPPAGAGVYQYEPYRGPGHLHMQEQITRAPAVCSYVLDDTETFFEVLACPEYGMLQLAVFETPIKPPA